MARPRTPTLRPVVSHALLLCHRPLRACALLCHDTVCRIVTQYQKWAVAHPVASSTFFFFFHSFFFPLFYSLQDHKFFFFHIFSRTNIFIIIYFIFIFFLVLHTMKLHKKISQHIFFIPPVASLLLLKCSSLNTVIYPIQNFKSLITNSFSCAKTGIIF